MYIKDIVDLIKDVKVNIEIIEKASGASFGFYTNKYVPIELLDKIAVEINAQYVDGKRLLIIEF